MEALQYCAFHNQPEAYCPCFNPPSQITAAAPTRRAGADSLHELVGRIRGLLSDVRAEEDKALPQWQADTERHEWAALYRCGNKLEEALGSLATIAPNEKLSHGAD